MYGSHDPGRRLIDAIARLRVETSGRMLTGLDHEGADDVHGTSATDDAIGFDPLPMLAAFDRHGAEVVVIGQVAGILHGSQETTGDLDLLWSGDDDQVDALVAAFTDVGASLTDDEGRPVAVGPAAFGLPKVLFRTEMACGDCCTPHLPWGRDVLPFVGRAERCDVDGVTVRYLRVDDLQAMRRGIGRPKDLRRVAELDRLHPT